MLQYILVFVIVGATVVYLVATSVKRLRSGGKSSPCQGCSGHCALKCGK